MVNQQQAPRPSRQRNGACPSPLPCLSLSSVVHSVCATRTADNGRCDCPVLGTHSQVSIAQPSAAPGRKMAKGWTLPTAKKRVALSTVSRGLEQPRMDVESIIKQLQVEVCDIP
ncbi:hypothetical protein PDE_06373 [Penicillium oxalicum 114-2]|uniref:Uncharacterized protein n=1 Tax=Penicillium oxalicum (strain 114-2 / CGMCC 5302) TaxID=933388 RepID=S8AYH1_PENO1|nr:hypothetical protein PDE_06373 [Penicillium oxalicum 114-2]